MVYFFVNMNKAFLNILRFQLLSNLQTLFVIHFFGSEVSPEGRTFVINFVDNLGRPGLCKAETLDSNIYGLYKLRSALKNVSDKSNDKILNVSLKTKNKLLQTRFVRKQQRYSL
jgi:hypothetical protein